MRAVSYTHLDVYKRQNLAPAMAGAKLFDHIRHMFYTTGVSYGIVAIIYIIIGLQYRGKVIDASEIQSCLLYTSRCV